jgi:signal transduction histidine kinase
MTAVHAVAAVVMAAAALFEAGYGGPEAELTGVSVTVSLLTGLSLLVARWSALAGAAVLALTIALPPLLVADLPPVGGAQLIATLLVVGYASYRLPRRLSLLVYVVLALVPSFTIVAMGESAWEFLFFVLILTPAWVVGLLLAREQRRSAELAALAEELRREREKQAEVAVAAERVRISRELHDAVAHTVSVMTLQVGVVRRRQQPDSVEEQTLRNAEAMGRQAVDELRRIVGLVREGEAAALAPLPSLREAEELVAQVRGTGTDVDLHLGGDLERVPPAVQASAYRIVQEGLTNALRHAPGAHVEVALGVDRDVLEVSVRNGPPTARSAVSDGAGGNGLVGLRERAHLLGGDLVAGAERGGGHRLLARLPLRARGVRDPGTPAAEVLGTTS